MEKIGGRCAEFGKCITHRIWERNRELPIDVGKRIREVMFIILKNSISRCWERNWDLYPDVGIRKSGDIARCWEMLGMFEVGKESGFGKIGF